MRAHGMVRIEMAAALSEEDCEKLKVVICSIVVVVYSRSFVVESYCSVNSSLAAVLSEEDCAKLKVGMLWYFF